MNYLIFLQRIRELTGGIFDGFFLKATTCGESILTFLLLAGIYWCVNKRAGQYMFFNVGFASSINQVVKNIFCIERPWVRDVRIIPVEGALQTATGYSFPSGHSSRAIATWGALGTYTWMDTLKNKDKRGLDLQRIISVMLWIVTLTVIFSRNYLAVHTLQDVIAAFLLGIICLVILSLVMNWVDNENSECKCKNRDVIFVICGCALLFFPMLRYGCMSNIGAGLGFLIGWIIERRFVKFQVEQSVFVKIVRFAVGGACLVLLLTSMSSLLAKWMPSKYAGFFAMFSVAIFISVLYPYLFMTIHHKGTKVVIAVLLACSVLVVSGTVIQMRLTATADIPEPIETIQETSPVKIIAHRGYSAVYPENTLTAFAGAADIGADMIELDVQESEDGIIVVFHDDDLMRITGMEGTIADYTCNELQQMDAGSWFSSEFAGEKIPTLAEALEIIRGTDLDIYLELKDIGEVEGFEEAVLQVVDEYDIRERCIFASFQYKYLQTYEGIDSQIKTLLNTTSDEVTLAEKYDVDYYGLSLQVVTKEQVDDIHVAGRQAFVWTVTEPEDMKNMIALGIDGITTNYPGRAEIVVKEEYAFLTDYYRNSVPLPGLYFGEHGAVSKTRLNVDDKIVQGLTKVGDELIVSAYSGSGEENSVLYLMNTEGNLSKVIDLGFKAHTGGVSYDAQHDLLWITGPDGKVYALSWSEIANSTENHAGAIQVEFDAGLLNHGASKVASFLTLYNNCLYVGSYVDGENGLLREYDITNIREPILINEYIIPQRIQGISFVKINGITQMLLTQSYQTDDSALLVFDYSEAVTSYEEPKQQFVLPEGAEQIHVVDNSNVYILFESAARPYRETARIVNDQIYLVDLGFLQ